MSQRPNRVVHLVPAMFGPDGGIVGGAERYVFELARHMVEEVPTRLVTFGDQDREERVGRLEIRVIGRPHYVRGQRNNPVSPRVLRELLGADVVHCHQQHVLGSSIAAALSRLAGKRVFVTDLGGGGWDVSGYVSTDRWFHGHLHISEYSRTVFGHAGRPWAHVILGGVDTEKFAPDPAASATRRSVLFVGRLLPHKGVDDLVAGIPADIPLEIIGQPYDARFVDDLRRLAEGKMVTFRHDCDDRALVEAYRNAFCVVLPSVYRTRYGDYTEVPELLGQTLLEGMACGSPVLCTDVGSMPEVVEDGVSGFVVPPNSPEAISDRIRALRDDPALVERMGRAARERVLSHFRWPVVVQRCLDIYRAA